MKPDHSSARHVGELGGRDQEAAAPMRRLEADSPSTRMGLPLGVHRASQAVLREVRQHPVSGFERLGAGCRRRGGEHQADRNACDDNRSAESCKQQADNRHRVRGGTGHGSVEPDPPRIRASWRRCCAHRDIRPFRRGCALSFQAKQSIALSADEGRRATGCPSVLRTD